MAERIGDVLCRLQKEKVVHRDIKPSNILFDAEGEVWLADFGLARQYVTRDEFEESRRLSTLCATLTRSSGSPCTVSYMSPEQARNESLGTPSDVFSLGVTLYEAACGRHPFPGKTVYETAHLVLGHEPAPLVSEIAGFPRCLSELIAGCLAKTPTCRPTPAIIVDCCKKWGGPCQLMDSNQSTLLPHGDQNERQTMNSIYDAVTFLRENDFGISEELTREMANLERPSYTVAVVGKYQVGKSRLINEVFLGGQPLLPVGEGLCTTAAATLVTRGDRARLAVYRWQKHQEAVSVDIDGQASSEMGDVTIGVQAAEIIDDPTPDDVRRFTAPDKEFDRAALAAEVQRVELIWPSEALGNYTFIDTPGVDDPNRSILDNTTYRIIPKSDIAVLVVGVKLLDQIELEFLRSRLFDAGISRLMVLISYHADADRKSAETRQTIVKSVQAQLQAIGRQDLPVMMYCFDPAVTGVGMLNTPKAIREAIFDYLDENTQNSRIEKAQRAVRCDLLQALRKVTTQIAFADRNAAEREELLTRIQEKETELKKEFAGVSDDVVCDVSAACQSLLARLNKELRRTMEAYADGFDECASLAEVQERLEKARSELRPEIEDVIIKLRIELRARLQEVASQYQQRLSELAGGGDSAPLSDVRVDAGPLVALPPSLVVLIDYILSILILPGGPIIDIILRLIAERIPLIKKILPSSIVATIAVRVTKKAVRKESDRVVTEATASFATAIKQVEGQLRTVLGERFEDEVASIRKTAEDIAPLAVSREEREHLAVLQEVLQDRLAAAH
jgi:hypothetical protein